MATYDDAILKRVNNAWGRYRSETKCSQAKAAKALGMNQSGFSQYLRGQIPLNTDFIKKFANLTGADNLETQMENRKQLINAATLDVIGNLSGASSNKKRRVIPLFADKSEYALIEIDYRAHFMPEGTALVVSRTGSIKCGDTVIMQREEKRPVMGQIKKDEDGWVVIEEHFFGGRSFHVSNADSVLRVVGACFPDSTGASYRDK